MLKPFHNGCEDSIVSIAIVVIKSQKKEEQGLTSAEPTNRVRVTPPHYGRQTRLRVGKEAGSYPATSPPDTGDEVRVS